MLESTRMSFSSEIHTKNETESTSSTTNHDKQYTEDNEGSFAAAVLEHAHFLGIDVDTDSELLYLAEECLLSPPPEPWVQYESDQGIPYYVSKTTGESQWDNPVDEIYKEKSKIIQP